MVQTLIPTTSEGLTSDPQANATVGYPVAAITRSLTMRRTTPEFVSYPAIASESDVRKTYERAGTGVGCGATGASAGAGETTVACVGGVGCPEDQIGLETKLQITNVTTARNTRLDYSHVYANPKRN